MTLFKSLRMLAVTLLCTMFTPLYADDGDVSIDRTPHIKSLQDVPFCLWDGWGANANPTDNAYCAWVVGESTDLPYGDVAVINYADLSAYDRLVVTVTEGSARLLFNRDIEEGQWDENEAESHLIDNTRGGWSEKYFFSETKEDGSTVCTVDLALMVKEKGFAHLHAIKGANWENVTVTSMVLQKLTISLQDVPFCSWDGWGANATPTGYADCAWVVGEPIVVPYGDLHVINYADLSAYDRLVVAVTEGTARLLFNRDIDDGQWNENEAESHLIDNTQGGWSGKYFFTETKEDGSTVCTVDLALMVKDKGFAHLHSIKGDNFENVTVTSMVLQIIPQGQTTNTHTLTITADNKTMNYGDDVPSLTYKSSGATLEGIPKLSTTATSSSPVGTYPIKVEQGTVSNGNVIYVDGTLTIEKAALTVGVQDVTITEGDPIPSFTLTYSGFRNGDTDSNAFSSRPTATTTATASSKPGTYPITISGGDAKNYALTYTQGTLTIKEKEQEPIADGTYSLTLDMFHEWDGCTATSRVVNRDCGGEIHVGEKLNAGNLVYGDIPVFYTQYADLTEYNTLVIIATPGMEFRVLLNRLEVGNGGGDDNGGSWTELNPVIGKDGKAVIDLSDYDYVHLNAIKTGLSSPEGVVESLNIVKGETEQPVTIIANDLTMTYGDEVPKLTYTTEGEELNGTPKLSTTATKNSPVGTYPIKVEQGTVTNEKVTYVEGTLTITQAPLTVGVRDVTITEGEDVPTFTLTYSGFRNNDYANRAFTRKPTATTTATSSSKPGTYPITVSGGEAKNYALTYTQGTLTIKEKPTTYTLSITSSGNGYVAYDGNTVRGKTASFSIVEGTNAILKFSADEGNRLKSVKVNGQNVTSTIVNNQYTVSNVKANTTIEVVFEAIPNYSLNIVATGNGKATYNGTAIRNQSQSFTLREGSSAVISFTPDTGYRIKSVTVNSTDVTSQVANGQITVSNITKNTNVEVSFEEIPPTTYSLTIKATGNGAVTYDGQSIRGGSSTFTVVEGSYATVQIVADDGYRLKRVLLDSKNVTADVADGQYTTTKIMANTTLAVEFEAVPTYTLTIKSSAFGSVKYGDAVITDQTQTFTVSEGTTAVLTFMADGNGRLQSITLNGNDITGQLTNGQYTISNIKANQSVVAVYDEDITKVTDAGVAYTVTSYEEQTVVVAAGNYEQVLTVPATFEAKGKTWKVTGMAEDALSKATGLAAIIWDPEVAFTAEVNNPNLLLYVKNAEYAPATIQNVVVNNLAENIVLVEAAEGNNFYCPKAFTAKYISYEHNYSMITGYKTCQGWETIVLPFDVSMMISSKGKELVPYVAWQDGSSQRPFWLYQLTSEGWLAANGIRANVPYIISMPNNEVYHSSYNIAGNVQFIGNNVEVKASDNVGANQYGNWRLMGNYQNKDANSSIYVLNVNNLWSQNTDTELEGSAFIRNLRAVHPFEAYMAWEGSGASQRVIPIFDDNLTTAIYNVSWMKADSRNDDNWYTLDGRKLQGEPRQNGIYIYKGKKVKK